MNSAYGLHIDNCKSAVPLHIFQLGRQECTRPKTTAKTSCSFSSLANRETHRPKLHFNCITAAIMHGIYVQRFYISPHKTSNSPTRTHMVQDILMSHVVPLRVIADVGRAYSQEARALN